MKEIKSCESPEVLACSFTRQTGECELKDRFWASHNTGFESYFPFASLCKEGRRVWGEVNGTVNRSLKHSPACISPSSFPQHVTGKNKAQETHLTTARCPSWERARHPEQEVVMGSEFQLGWPCLSWITAFVSPIIKSRHFSPNCRETRLPAGHLLLWTSFSPARPKSESPSLGL